MNQRIEGGGAGRERVPFEVEEKIIILVKIVSMHKFVNMH